ncbi:hypothetical protein Tco_0210332 [Tanacetum coccineum]
MVVAYRFATDSILDRYFDVDLTVRKLVMNRLGQLLWNFRRKLRQTYILPNQDTPSELIYLFYNRQHYTSKRFLILCCKVKSAKAKMAHSKCVFPHTMGRGGYAHVKEKMKETEDKIKEGTLQVDQGTDAMTLVLVMKESLLLESQLDAARREREEKELLIKSMSSKMSQTEGMVSPVGQFILINSIADEEGRTMLLDVIRMMRAFGRKCKKGNVKSVWELSIRLINTKGFYK